MFWGGIDRIKLHLRRKPSLVSACKRDLTNAEEEVMNAHDEGNEQEAMGLAQALAKKRDVMKRIASARSSKIESKDKKLPIEPVGTEPDVPHTPHVHSQSPDKSAHPLTSEQASAVAASSSPVNTAAATPDRVVPLPTNPQPCTDSSYDVQDGGNARNDAKGATTALLQGAQSMQDFKSGETKRDSASMAASPTTIGTCQEAATATATAVVGTSADGTGASTAATPATPATADAAPTTHAIASTIPEAHGDSSMQHALDSSASGKDTHMTD